MKKTINVRLARAIKLAAAVSVLPLATQVQALNFQVTDDVKADLDTTLTYGRQYRLDERDRRLLTYGDDAQTLGPAFNPLGHDFHELAQRMNGDDGNRNFDRGDVTSSRFTLLTDLNMSYDKYGVFLRGQMYYDEVPYGKAHWYSKDLNKVGSGDPRLDNNLYASGDIADTSHFGSDYQNTSGYKARFLDAYLYGSFDVGTASNLEVRAGRQVISWGEALMLQGGIAFAQNRVDSSASTVPGVELKEIFLPTGAIYGQLGLTEKVTVEAYWQYEWIPSTLFPTGSFFEMQDFIDGDAFVAGAAGTYGSGVMARKTHDGNENDQYGFATRYLLDNGTELGLYIVNYTDKYPMFWAGNKLGQTGTGAGAGHATPGDGLNTAMDGRYYSISYFDNIRLYGLAVNTVIGGVQTGIEYAYRANAPIVPACDARHIQTHQCKDPMYAAAGSPAYIPGLENALTSWPTRAEVHNLNIGGTYIFQPNALWDTATLVGELGSWWIGGYENHDLQFAYLGAFTQTGQGMSMQFMPEYKNVMEGVDITIPLFVNYGINGSMSTFNYNEHSLWASIGVEAVYLEHWRGSIIYSDFSGPNNLWRDRDNIAFNVKYIF